MFNSKLAAAIKKLRLGNGLDEQVHIGPLVEEKAVKFVEDLVADAKDHGAQILTGGKRYNLHEDSLIYEPTLLTDATQNMRIFREEIFGPVAPIYKFKNEEEVIKMAKFPLSLKALTDDRVWNANTAADIKSTVFHPTATYCQTSLFP